MTVFFGPVRTWCGPTGTVIRAPAMHRPARWLAPAAERPKWPARLPSLGDRFNAPTEARDKDVDKRTIVDLRRMLSNAGLAP